MKYLLLFQNNWLENKTKALIKDSKSYFVFNPPYPLTLERLNIYLIPEICDEKHYKNLALHTEIECMRVHQRSIAISLSWQMNAHLWNLEIAMWYGEIQTLQLLFCSVYKKHSFLSGRLPKMASKRQYATWQYCLKQTLLSLVLLVHGKWELF